MYIDTRAALSVTRQHMPHLGIDLPEGLTADLEEIDRALGNRNALVSSRRALADAIATALTAGKDPATDKTVLAHLARESLRTMNLGAELDTVVAERSGEALRRHLDSIIESLAAVLDRADVTLAEARDNIDNLDLTDDSRVKILPPASMALWGRAREAADHVTRVAQVWTLLVGACGQVEVPPHRKPLVVADLSFAELAAIGHQPSAVAAVHAGYRLSLATPTTFAERLERLEDDRAYQAQQHERDFKETFRRLRGMGGMVKIP